MIPKIKDIKEVLQYDKGCDTRKSLNRNASFVVPQSIVESIEKDGVTTEMLTDLNTDVFKYKGQITIHGIFNTSNDSFSIGGYKNIIVNGNGSIGVKYNAIDYDKKYRIYNAMKTMLNFYISKNSTEYKAYNYKTIKDEKEFNDTIKEYTDIIKRIDKTGVLGTYNCYYGNTLFGIVVCIEINILSILEVNVNTFIESICDCKMVDYENKLKQIQVEEIAKRDKWKIQNDIKEKEENEIKEQNIATIIKLGYKLITPTESCSGFIIDRYGVKFVEYRIDKKDKRKKPRIATQTLYNESIENFEIPTFSDYKFSVCSNIKPIYVKVK